MRELTPTDDKYPDCLLLLDMQGNKGDRAILLYTNKWYDNSIMYLWIIPSDFKLRQCITYMPNLHYAYNKSG